MRHTVDRGAQEVGVTGAGTFEEFALGQAQALRRLAYGISGNWQDADDLVQATLERAFARWDRIERADSPEAYVRTVLLHLAISEHRRPWRRRESSSESLPEDSRGADDMARAGDRLDLARALHGLPVKQRAVMVLRFVEDRSVRETATILRIAEGTVKRQTHDAVTRLRHVLGGEGATACEVPDV